MNGAVGLPAKDDVLTENLLKKKRKHLLYEMVEISNRNLFIIGQIATRYYFGEIPEEQNRKKEYLSFA